MSRTKHILSYAIPIVILLFFLFGSFFAPHDPTATNIRDKYLPSSAEYPFGTDDFGRCEWHLVGKDGTPQKYSCRKYLERSYSDTAGGLSDYLHRYLGEQYPHHAGGTDGIFNPSDD